MSRVEKVASAMQKEISKIIQTELNDPRLGFITVIKVEVSKDLEHAKVFYSVLGDEEAARKSQEGLESAAGYMKKLVGDRLQLRLTPEIIFRLDNSAEYSVYISKKLDQIKEEEKKSEPGKNS